MPLYIKIILLIQATAILSFTVFMYQVYMNDIFFQQYVISLLASSIIADATLSIVTASVFALGTFTLLGSMTSNRRANKEWRLLSEEAKAPHMPSLPVLEVVKRLSKPRAASRRPRSRKPSANVDKLYESVRYFADDRREQ
jgi:F0F1-type ATP synthase membrane subunit a